MIYSARITENLTVTYASNTVSIRLVEPYWNHTPDQTVDIPVDKLNMLILALQDIANIKSKEW